MAHFFVWIVMFHCNLERANIEDIFDPGRVAVIPMLASLYRTRVMLSQRVR